MPHNDKNACEFSSEIVGYMYDELTLANRELFETHLADCTSCIDEFAGVSNSRYSVYEWRKVEFDPLETPVFDIPYADRTREVATQKPGWLDALAGVFAIGRTPMFAAGAVIVVIALGFAAFTMLRPAKEEVAIVPATNTPAPPSPNVEVAVPKEPSAAAVRSEERQTAVPEPVKASTPVRKAPTVRSQYASNRVRTIENVPNPSRLAKKAPRLSEAADEDEETLRLADLLGEIGG